MRARWRRTIPQLNTLFNNPDEENRTEIEVTDPTHPLFGRHFPLISVSSPLHGPGFAFVFYREYMVLRLPVASTTLAPSRPVVSTKLTLDAVKELMTIAEDCEALNVLSPKPNLEAPASRTATPDQRRPLVDPKGRYSMSRSELVSPLHLQRKALIYIRQSTPHQVLSNQESLQLQSALQQRALELGWRAEDIELIDTDLGLTAAFASHRSGFQELVTKVSLGQVGIVLSVEVTRLSRNCSDWYPLLDVCGYRGCLSADRDGISDPGSANGRLLLGLKGQLSELELHTIRARMTAGLLNKAQRGELALSLPIGLVRDAIGKVRHPIPIARFKTVLISSLRRSCR